MSYSNTRRMERYRLSEPTRTEARSANDPTDSLRRRGITISFHYDIEAQFERIHKLVNRTNELNFTKVRWKEALDVAHREYFAGNVYLSHVGYIKVRDQNGYYGICGFFEVVGSFRLKHFLFSSRILNMGVEQFVYQYLNFPAINVAETVATTLAKSHTVDWLTIVPDAEKRDAKKPDITVCLRGSCELVQSAYYLRSSVNTVEEFHYTREGWNIRRPLLRNLLLADELKERGISSPADLGLPGDFPGIDFAAFGSAISADNVDVCVWSFWLEPLVSFYRHRATGIIVPLSVVGFDRRNLTALDGERVSMSGKIQVERNHLDALCSSFEYIGEKDSAFGVDLRKLRRKIEALGKPFVVVDLFDDFTKIKRMNYRRNREFNLLVRLALAGLPNVYHIAFSECVADKSDELATNHFGQRPYIRLAERIGRLCEAAVHRSRAGGGMMEGVPRAAKNTWRYELHYRDGRLLTSRERQTFEQVWHAAMHCRPRFDTLKFAAPSDATQTEIDQLVQLGAARFD